MLGLGGSGNFIRLHRNTVYYYNFFDWILTVSPCVSLGFTYIKLIVFSFSGSSFLLGTRCTMTILPRPTWSIQSSLLRVSSKTGIESIQM